MATAVRLVLRSDEFEDVGVGIVIARQPLTLLVPDHVLVLMDEGVAAILVDGEEYTEVRRLPAPALAKDHLALLRLGRKGLKNAVPARLPRAPAFLQAGRAVRVVGTDPLPKRGAVADILRRGEHVAIVTDIDIRPGESGSALMVGEELVGVCQGRAMTSDGGRAVAVLLSREALREIRRARNRHRVRMLTVLVSVLLAAVLGLGAMGIRSSISFRLAGIDVEERSPTITALNGQALTFRSSWSRTFETRIRRFEIISPTPEGAPTHVAVGTVPEDGKNGAFHLLDRLGNVLWSYSVPDGECIYQAPSRTYDLYLVDGIYCADPDADGENELLVVFVHDHHEPCKLVAFEFSGEIVAEYWHPGYIRTMAFGSVGPLGAPPLVVASASNNAIKTSWWNPQTLFAFRGLDIAGQAPPYLGEHGDESALDPGRELWYRVIENIDPESIRGLCYKISIGDYNGDGRMEIRAALTDGRFYYLDEQGDTLWIDLADRWAKEFGDAPAPPLVDLPLRQSR